MTTLDPRIVEIARATAERRIIDPAMRPAFEDVLIDGIQTALSSLPEQAVTEERGDVQSRIEGTLVARMIIEFHGAMRDTYGPDVMTSNLCAVGPLQSMIGLAIKNGHLAIARPSGDGVQAGRAEVKP